MRKFSLYSSFVFLISAISNAHALELAGNTSLLADEWRVKFGVSFISGLVSPPPTYTHITGVNKSFLMKEAISISHGFGDVLLKDMYMELETDVYQSRSETFNGALIQPRDRGFISTLRVGGNWIHERRFTLGSWLQSSIPFYYNDLKFVNPVVNTLGVGTNATFLFIPEIGLSQSVFVGSGLFNPRRRNPNLQSSTLGIFNIGKLLFSHDIIFRTGWVVEWDLTSRLDAAYQASALGDGRIKNLINMSPFLLTIPFANSWAVDFGYVLKWGFAGKSIRGTRFASFALSKIF